MVTEIKAPEPLLKYNKGFHRKIFLAGSIDQGDAPDWQSDVVKRLKERYDRSQAMRLVDRKILILNPRRDNWNKDMDQSIDNVEFQRQVTWELDNLEKADSIIMNFTKDSKAPITLMELGLFADSGKIKLICPPDFYRRGNIEIIAEKFNIPLYNSIGEMFDLETVI